MSGRLGAGLVAALLSAGLLSGCGGAGDSPGQAAPEVKAALTRVGDAVTAGKYGVARDALDTMTQQTVQARQDGTLRAEQADRILAAVARLRNDLPAAQPAPPSRPAESSAPENTDDGDDHGGPGKRDDDGDEGHKSGPGHGGDD